MRKLAAAAIAATDGMTTASEGQRTLSQPRYLYLVLILILLLLLYWIARIVRYESRSFRK